MVKRAVVRFPAGMPRIHWRAFATESSDEQDCDFGRQLAANDPAKAGVPDQADRHIGGSEITGFAALAHDNKQRRKSADLFSNLFSLDDFSGAISALLPMKRGGGGNRTRE
jgi:hypothetical protein